MITANIGSTVTLSYIGTLDNGKIFHSTDQHGPLVFTIGNDQLFPALEQEIIGMHTGEVKNIVLSPDEAYGPRLQENIMVISRSTFPVGKEITVGQKISIEFKGGQSRIMMVIAVDGLEVTLDGNHPLAGCELTFAVRVDSIELGNA